LANAHANLTACKQNCFCFFYYLRYAADLVMAKTTSPTRNTLVVMRHNDGHRYNGKTRGNISVDNFSTFGLGKQFFKFLLSFPRSVDTTDLNLSHISAILFAPQATRQLKQTKTLQSPSHIAFFKSILAIPKQSTFIFASTKAKINKLCCLPEKISVLRTLFALGLDAPKGAPQAYGNLKSVYYGFC
ncbi:MAG: hypothetical protein ACK5QC_01165, partial [Bacteroidota bacterium]